MEQKNIIDLTNKNLQLQEENTSLKNTIDTLNAAILNKDNEIAMLRRYLFGKKRESVKKEDNIVGGVQCSMFDTPEEVKEEVEKATEEIIVYRKKKNNTSGIKRAAIKNVENITEEYVLEDEQKHCNVCNGELKYVNKEVVRQEIKYIPAKLQIVNYVRNIYKCNDCGNNNSSKDTPTFVKTRVPHPLLTHSFVSPSLATEVIYQKYCMGSPLYRQEKMWDDLGLVLPRNMMANWCIKLSEYYLEPLVNLILNKLKECELLHIDETTMQVNKEEGKVASTKSYMWVMSSGDMEKIKAAIFWYSPNRSTSTAIKLLKGYKNILVTDGYDVYNAFENDVTHAECWAHARRYFYDSIPLINKKMDTSSSGYEAVVLIDKLFAIEKKIDDASIDKETNPKEWLDKKYAIRQEESKPILKKIFEWVNLTSQKYIVNEKLKKALTYMQNQQKQLSEFLNDARIPLTNSRCERTIRPFAVHRKNWLFADTTDGAKASATYYSLIESAKMNKLNVYKYIEYLLTELSQLEGQQKEEDLLKYLPWSEELPPEIRNYDDESETTKLEEA